MSLFVRPSSVSGEREWLVKSDDALLTAPDWSPGDRFVVYTRMLMSWTDSDLWTVPFAGDRKPAVFLATPHIEAGGTFSPDGRWIAYESNVSGRNEIYVRPFPVQAWTVPCLTRWRVGTAVASRRQGALLPVTRGHVDGGWHRHDEEPCPKPSSAALHDRAQTRELPPVHRDPGRPALSDSARNASCTDHRGVELGDEASQVARGICRSLSGRYDNDGPRNRIRPYCLRPEIKRRSSSAVAGTITPLPPVTLEPFGAAHIRRCRVENPETNFSTRCSRPFRIGTGRNVAIPARWGAHPSPARETVANKLFTTASGGKAMAVSC